MNPLKTLYLGLAAMAMSMQAMAAPSVDFTALCSYGEDCRVNKPTLIGFGSKGKLAMRTKTGQFTCHGAALGKSRPVTGNEQCFVYAESVTSKTGPAARLPVTRSSGRAAQLPAGAYAIVSRFSGKALEVRGGSLNDGAFITQSDFTDGPHQIWKITPIGKAHYSIIAFHSGKSLQARESFNSDGARLQQYAWSDQHHQHWLIEPYDDDGWRITSRHNGTSVDVYEMNQNNQGAVVTWSFWGGDNQLWNFIPVDTADLEPN